MAPRNNNCEREARKANHMKKILGGNEKTKNMSYKKRFPTLEKKAKELETLCDVSVRILCFGRDGKVHMVPDNEAEMKDLIYRFKGIAESAKKEINLVEFLEEQDRKHKAKKLDEEFLKLSGVIEGLNESDALSFLNYKLTSFKEKLGFLSSQKQKTACVNQVCGFNTNILGLGLEPNWVYEQGMTSGNKLYF